MQSKRPSLRHCFSILAGVFLLWPDISVAQSDSVKGIVHPFRVARSGTNNTQFPKKCPKGISVPPIDLIFQSRYEDDDPTRSIVNDAYEERYQNLIRPLRRFESSIVMSANNHLRGQSGAAFCVGQALEQWALDQALLSVETNTQGEMVRAWMLASFGSAWAQVSSSGDISTQTRRTVDLWLQRLSDVVKKDFRAGQAARGKNNNHAYWANWALAITAAAVGNESDLKTAHQRYRQFLEDIGPDGSLVHEKTRGVRILYYHVYAAGPLYLQTELFRRNKMTRKSDIQTIDRLMDTVALGVIDTDSFQEKIGTTGHQDRSFMKTTTPEILHLALCREPDNHIYGTAYKVYRRIMPAPGPYTRLGGDFSLLRSCGTKAAQRAFDLNTIQ